MAFNFKSIVVILFLIWCTVVKTIVAAAHGESGKQFLENNLPRWLTIIRKFGRRLE
jgi:putative Ca2+/H+ antiporter (TMEM165/GDT1 family)